MKILGIDVTNEEFNFLMCEQSQGKELKVVDGKIVAVEYKPTEFDLLQQELLEINTWFDEYDNQVKQYQRCQRLGIEFDRDIVELDNQAKINQERIREINKILNQG